MKDERMTEKQEACLRTVMVMMTANGEPDPTNEAALDRALAMAAEAARDHLVHELGTEERADRRLKEFKAYPFDNAD